MNLRELEAQAEFLAPVIAAAVAKAVASLNLELADLRKCLADRPMPVEPEPVDLEALAQSAAALVVLPEVKDGKDAEPVDLEALAKAAAEFVELPKIDIALLAAEAAKLVDVPEPLPGKDADPVDLQALARSAAELIHVPEVRQPQDGRDALHLEILPTIDEAKTYARNTYAKHDGGLWRSFEQTSGMRGWECIVEGLKAVSVTQDGDRQFSVKLLKSSGHEVVQNFAMPIQIYKGVFREEQTYDAHDNVTWAGSQWTSTKAQNTDKPGSSDAWTLCVKAGRNGKDLRENASTFDPAKGVKL
jgi:hypothetical protein